MVTNQEALGEVPLLLRIHPDLTQLTRLGRTTLYGEIAAGRLRAVRIGRTVRVRRDDLDAWLDRHAHGGEAAHFDRPEQLDGSAP